MTATDTHESIKKYIRPVHTLFFAEETIRESLKALRKKKIMEEVVYFYVINEKRKLVGVVTTRDLLLKDSDTKIAQIARKKVIALDEESTLYQAMEIMQKQQLLALPVVDKEGEFLGVVDVGSYLDRSVDVADTKRRVEIFQMLGFSLQEGRRPTPWKSYANRMPWIFCNMLGGVGCAIISWLFEDVLAKVLILAMFIPLVLSLSESISMQAMTQSLYRAGKKRISKKVFMKEIFHESKLFALLAITCGSSVGLISLLWGDGYLPALVICIGISISVLLTALIGSTLPWILHSKKWDPRVAAGPLVLMCADLMTTLIYLSLATWWIS